MQSYRNIFHQEGQNVNVVSARAGNVIGGGDWAENRLIPDIIRALECERTVGVRNQNSIRPWQPVLEPLSGYLLLAQKVEDRSFLGDTLNFGPNDLGLINVENVIIEMQKNSSKDVIVEFNRDDSKHEASLLKLDASKVKKHLNWSGWWNFQQTIKYTAEWYENFYSKKNMYDVSVDQFNQYIHKGSS